MSSGGHLEIRRMEQLSNTIFGVAMTLLAYQAPRDKFSSADPQWREIWHLYGAYLSTLLLSFIVAGMFWYSYQRRLAYSSHASRGEIMVHLLFLLSVILLPVTCGLYGNNYDSGRATMLYSINLLLIGFFNVVLWAMAVAPRRDWTRLATPLVPLVLFVVALAACVVDPGWPKYIWPLGFLAPIVSAYIERRERS